MRRALRTLTLATGIVAGGVWIGPQPAIADPDRPSEADLERAIATAEDLSIAFEHAATSVAPSVVNVQAAARLSSRGGSGRSMEDLLEDSPLRQFFGDEFFERFEGRGGPESSEPGWVRRGQGSGFIVSENGHILTNNHVVEGATKILVRLGDDREYEAELVGTDPGTDLAVVKVDASGLTPVRFGNSDTLRLGEWVVAVGSPFALERTITAGVVSAKGRSRVGITDYEDFIQTDAAINPGNSGGPLVNLRGEVVGVNTAIATRSGGNMGVGFAIPSNIAEFISTRLIEEGEVRRGWLGVTIQNLTEGLARSFGYEGSDGVLVGQAYEDTPAEEAGLREGDIIISFDGKPVADMDELRLRVAQTSPGRTVDVTIFRDGEERTIDVTIGEREQGARVAPDARDDERWARDEIGLELRTLDEEMARRLGLDIEGGVLITDVEPFSAAARAGLRPRDVIVEVQGRRVETVRAFRGALQRSDLEEGVRLTVHSGAGRRFVFLEVR